MGTSTNVGQIHFLSNLDQVNIGYYYGYYSYQSLASIEFYLRALSTAEIAQAMNQSYTLPFNPNCDVDN
jgi:hypothetical protein